MFLDTLQDPYQHSVATGINIEARRHDLDLWTFIGGTLDGSDFLGRGAPGNFVYQLAGADSLHGLVLLSGPLSNAIGPGGLLRFLDGYPNLKACSIGVKLPRVPSVLIDNVLGLQELVAHLIEGHGYQRIAFIGGPRGNTEAEERRAAYRNALATHGIMLDPDLELPGRFTTDCGNRAIRELLDVRKLSVDAIVAANDNMALGAIRELTDRGIEVPGNIAVVGFDDTDLARCSTPTLTTVRQPLELLGREALKLIIAQFETTDLPEDVTVATAPVRRESCGCHQQIYSSYSHPPVALVGSADERDSLTCSGAQRKGTNEHALVARLKDSRARLLAAAEVRLSAGGLRPKRARLETVMDLCIDAAAAESTKPFEEQLRREMILAGAEHGDVHQWQELLLLLVESCRSEVGPHAVTARLAWTRGLALIGSVAQRQEADTRLKSNNWLRAVRHLSGRLLNTLQLDKLTNILNEALPDLGIGSCMVALFDEPSTIAGTLRHAKLVAISGTDTINPGDLEPFLPSQLLPDGLRLPNERQSLTVVPIRFEREQLGYAVMGMTGTDSEVYESVAGLLGNVVKAATMVTTLRTESERRLAAEREGQERELHIAARMQKTILPREANVPCFQISAGMFPATEVGGDYYDVVPTEKGCWIGIGDVSGHGLASGLVMLMAQSALGALVRHTPEAPPRAILKSLNSLLVENIRNRMNGDDHATLTVLHFDCDGKVTFAGAHEDLLLCRGMRCTAIPTPGPWVGVNREVERSMVDSELQLEPGDVMLLYTDGVTEGRNSKGEMLGLQPILDMLEDVADESVDTIRNLVVSLVLDWTHEQVDDITVLVLRYQP